MKIKSHLMLALLCVAAMSYSTTATATTSSYLEHHDDYKVMKLHRSIIEANAVVIGTVEYVPSREKIERMMKGDRQVHYSRLRNLSFFQAAEKVRRMHPY